MGDPPHSGVPYFQYVSGATVKVVANFVNAAGAPADPTSVTAVAQFGPVSLVPGVSQAVVRDGTGAYHVEIATAGWLGPGPQVVTVTFTATGTIQATVQDAFEVIPNPSTAFDVLGP